MGRKEYDKQYREKNKEKRKEYKKKYRQENKEKIKESNKQYREEHKEKINEYKKQYYKENIESRKQYIKQYNQTPRGLKLRRIKDWKKRGFKCDYIEELYQHYLLSDQCEKCSVILTVDKITTSTTKSMDHSHITGEFRNILCHACNRKRGESNF